MQLLKDGRVIADEWTYVDGETAASDDLDVIAPLERVLAGGFEARRGRLGVLLEPDDDPDLLASRLDAIELIAVRFPVFKDGRGYSTAQILRNRLKFKGELRAIGDFGRDQFKDLLRAGFDALETAEPDPEKAWRESASLFPGAYQSAAAGPAAHWKARLR